MSDISSEPLPEHKRIIKEIQDRIQMYRDDMTLFGLDDARYKAARTASYALLCLLEDLGYSL
jgi:hypothetical protein